MPRAVCLRGAVQGGGGEVQPFSTSHPQRSKAPCIHPILV